MNLGVRRELCHFLSFAKEGLKHPRACIAVAEKLFFRGRTKSGGSTSSSTSEN